MIIELKELSMDDGKDIFDMIKEIGPGENGYTNTGYDMDYQSFSGYLQMNSDMAKGINLQPQFVPQTMYWLFVDKKPVGAGKLRDHLNDNLKKNGGHIGYTIRPSERGKGYGVLILRELLKKAKEKGIEEVLITCRESNIASRKVIEHNGCELVEINNQQCYWRKRLGSSI
ncbi:MAG: GNAT family N-acetyltransferase [Clostridia bacterium]|nr:GNAT family N-acetyltransferase [Clostridia bacterium]